MVGPVAKYLSAFREDLASWMHVLRMISAGVNLYDMFLNLCFAEGEDPIAKAFQQMAAKITGHFA